MAASVVLTIHDYHSAYGEGGYRRLFDNLWTSERIVFVGFGFSDPWFEFLASHVIHDRVSGRGAEQETFRGTAVEKEEAGL